MSPTGINQLGRYEVVAELGERDGACWYLGRIGFGQHHKHALVRRWLTEIESYDDLFAVHPSAWNLCDQHNVDFWFDLEIHQRRVMMATGASSATDVATVLETGGPRLTQAQVLHIADGVCHALSAIGQDNASSGMAASFPQVNPRSVRLRLDGFAALTGVELSYFKDPRATHDPRFAAPEELQGQRTGPRSEVYRIGLLMYLLLVRGHPTAATDTTREEVLRSLAPDEEQVAGLIRRALETDPGRRHAGPLELGRAIRDCPALDAAAGPCLSLSQTLADVLQLTPAERERALPSPGDAAFFDWLQYPGQVEEPDDWQDGATPTAPTPTPVLVLDGLRAFRDRR